MPQLRLQLLLRLWLNGTRLQLGVQAHMLPTAHTSIPPICCLQEFVGFFGRSLVQGCAGRHCPKGSEPNCVVPRTIPWVDLLPKGAQ